MRQEVSATATPNNFDLLEDWVEVRYFDTRQVPDPDFVQVSETIPNPAFDEDPTEPEVIPNPDFPQDFSMVDEEFHVETAEFRALLKSDGTVETGENYGKIIARVRTGIDFRTGAKSPPPPDHPAPKRPDHPVNVP